MFVSLITVPDLLCDIHIEQHVALMWVFFFTTAQQPPKGQSLLIIED